MQIGNIDFPVGVRKRKIQHFKSHKIVEIFSNNDGMMRVNS